MRKIEVAEKEKEYDEEVEKFNVSKKKKNVDEHENKS